MQWNDWKDAPKDGTMIIAVHADYSGCNMLFWGMCISTDEDGWVTADLVYDGPDAEYAGWIPCPDKRTQSDNQS